MGPAVRGSGLSHRVTLDWRCCLGLSFLLLGGKGSMDWVVSGKSLSPRVLQLSLGKTEEHSLGPGHCSDRPHL